MSKQMAFQERSQLKVDSTHVRTPKNGQKIKDINEKKQTLVK